MKSRAKRRRVPQFELPIANEPFALVAENSVDGDRLNQQLRQSDTDRAEAEKHQLKLQPKGIN